MWLAFIRIYYHKRDHELKMVLKVYWNKFKQVLQFSNQNIQTILPDTQFLFLHYIYHISHSLKNLAPFSAEHTSFYVKDKIFGIKGYLNSIYKF